MNRTKKAHHAILLIAIVALCTMLINAACGAEPTFRQLEKVRPNYTTGYGYIIDDLEQHTKAGHPMRNEGDPGNWVHELTHQLNSDIRMKYRGHVNGFYLFMGEYVVLTEPKIKLRDVAKAIPADQRGESYKEYLIAMQRYWNNEPLYVLDEMTAMVNALHYHFITETKDAKRRSLVVEFINYSEALLRAVEKGDPNYTQMEELRAFIQWSQRRAQAVIDVYDGKPPEIDPNDPVPHDDEELTPLYGGRYHLRKRTVKFFKRLAA